MRLNIWCSDISDKKREKCMFFIHKSALRQDIFDRNSVFFSSAELPLFQPWFLCEVPEYEDDEILTYTTYLFADLESLTLFANSQTPTRTYVMSPGHMNKSEKWMLQTLKAVSQAKYTNDSGSNTVYRFEFEDGEAFDRDLSGMGQTIQELNFQTVLKFI